MDESAPEPPNPKGGRPSKLTPDLALAIAAAILDGNYRKVAAKRYGVGYTTLRRWMRLGVQFPDGLYGQLRTLVLESEAETERKAIASVLKAGHEDDPRHLQWWLERKFPERWGRMRGELNSLRKELAELRVALGVDATVPATIPRRD